MLPQFLSYNKIYTRMPKGAQSSLSKVQAYVARYPTEFMATTRGELFCTLCSTIVSHCKKFSIDKHRQSKKHQKALPSTSQQRQQPLSIPTTSFDWNDYVGKVTAAFLSADIPLYKLNNPDLQALFKYVGQRAPSEFACRKRIDDMGKCEVNRICNILSDKVIFMVIDETDVSGCKYINTLVGDIEQPETTYLLHCKTLDASPNQQSVIHAVDDAIRTLETDRDNFVLLLTDAARYMTAAGRVVKQTYPRLFHITCVAHGLHNAAERIRANYEDVDKLIASVKASVVKNKDRKAKFSAINSPPQPVVTRWGSWLKAAEYYAKKFPQVREIINAFEGTGQLVVKAKEAVAVESLPGSLREIYQCYLKLVDEIQRAESTKYTVAQAYEKAYTLEFGSDPAGIKLYLGRRFEMNSDLKAIAEMTRPNISPELYAKLLNCQATSCSVERSFSMLRKLLAKDRHFTPDNVWKYLALYVNKSLE